MTSPPDPASTPSEASSAGPAARSSGRPHPAWSWAARVVALLGVMVTVMVVALGVGMRLDDAEIDEHPGTATATVLSVSPLRTGIEFVEAGGLTIRPAAGVLYPGLLSVGQEFLVEYSTQDPTVVRVAGRTAAVGTLPLVFTLMGTVAFAGPALWFLLRRSRRHPNAPPA